MFHRVMYSSLFTRAPVVKNEIATFEMVAEFVLNGRKNFTGKRLPDTFDGYSLNVVNYVKDVLRGGRDSVDLAMLEQGIDVDTGFHLPSLAYHGLYTGPFES